MKTTAPLLALLALSLCAARAEESVFFAFDDVAIPWRSNLKLTMATADKHPANPVLTRGPDGTPDHGHAIMYGSVLRVGGKFRMWYLGMSQTVIEKGQAPGYWRPMCYAESDDGVHWEKPELGLVEFKGSTKNNICLIEGEPFSLTRVDDFLSVLHDPADPDPARRFKVAYIAHVPLEQIPSGMSTVGKKERLICSTVCATSADGLRWKVVGDRPANAGGERFEVSSLYRFGDFFYTTGQLIPPWTWRADGSDARTEGGGNSGRVMLAYRSPDFVKWSQAKAFAFARPGQLANPPSKGQQTHMGAGMWNRGNVLLGLYGQWQDAEVPPGKGESFNKGVHVDLGLIVSNDGIHFREPVPGFKVIARGEPGAWDDTALLQGHAFVNDGERTMIWYSHWDTGGKMKTMDIGLATLRRDGFGHLSRMAETNDAHFITDTFTAGKNAALSINVDGITPDAPLTIELLDHRDQPLASFAATLTTNGTQQQIAWPNGAALAAGVRFSVRVKYPANSAARVFAVYLTE